MISVAEVAGIVDTDHYPLAEPGSPHWARAVVGARRDLRESGCSVLRDFVPARRLDVLRAECASVAGKAYYGEQVVNVYNTVPDPSLPADHPARRTTVRGNAFVARDDIPADFIIHRLYACGQFQRFLADCFGLPAVYPLADPFSGLTVNVVVPGQEHPWHFDTNEFAVSMVTQEPAGGGEFQYCPHIRSAGAENLEDVSAVLRGAGNGLVRRLSLRPGDLQLFHGRYSLHRVTQVRGTVARHSAIFAYSSRPGVVGNTERTRQLFGRVTEAHGPNGHGRAGEDDGLLA